MNTTWRRSTHCHSGGCLETRWKKSSRSGGNGCIEARNTGVVQVRDSKQDNGPILTFTPIRWRQFVHAVISGEIQP